MSDPTREKLELKGTALRVYVALLKKGGSGAGPRAIQKELELASPNAVVYHLERLISLGLVEKDLSGNYKEEFLRLYTRAR
jgi:predicted transcriptional regulator